MIITDDFPFFFFAVVCVKHQAGSNATDGCRSIIQDNYEKCFLKGLMC